MEYHDLMQKLKDLAEKPVIHLPDRTRSEALKQYDQRFKNSKLLAMEAKNIIPGGHEHQNAIKNPFTIFMHKAQDAYLYDMDGNRFVDFLMASGPILLGHNYPELRDFAVDIIKERGPITGVMVDHEILAAKEIMKHFKSIERLRFYQSGTEVGMAAARLARCFTGKEYIIKVGGSYHGWSDTLVYDLHLPGTANMFSYGIPNGAIEKTLSVKPNDTHRIEKLITMHEKEGKGGVAAVFLEGLGGDGGTWYVPPEFYKEVRDICDKHGVLLVMDEVITGFRLAMGGAQEYFGVKADITMLGKIVGHGFPSAGALGGRADIMAFLAGQAEKVDKGGQAIEKSVMTAGTMAGNTLTCAVAAKAIQLIEKTDAINIAGKAATKICNGVNDIFQRAGLPFFAYNFQSIMHMPMSGFYFVNMNKPDALQQVDVRRKVLQDYQMLLMLENVNSLQAMRYYTCLMHDDKAIYDETFEAFEHFCKKLKA